MLQNHLLRKPASPGNQYSAFREWRALLGQAGGGQGRWILFSRLTGNAFPGGHSLSQHFLLLSSSLQCFSSCLMPQALASLSLISRFTGSVYVPVVRTWGWAMDDGTALSIAEEERNRTQLPLGCSSVWSNRKTHVLSSCQYSQLLWCRPQGGIFLHLNCLRECASS